MEGFFVTGTDTGIGKTRVSAGLLKAFAGLGRKSVGMKPVASGAAMTPEGLRNEDALLLQSAASEQRAYGLVNPY
ncbi:MAG TPA: AAA family ATPase, partial [Gammaproteobacteria bacterium]|nr:AAA family ATPase [Gammaproteobacteria bacterium]